MRMSSSILGVDGRISTEQDDWLDEFIDDSDLDNAIYRDEDDELEVVSMVHPRVRFGWPALQAEGIRDIIRISEVADGIVPLT